MRHSLGASLHAELAVDVTGMGLDRVQGDEQALATAITAALDDQTPPDVIARAADFGVEQAVDGQEPRRAAFRPDEPGAWSSPGQNFRFCYAMPHHPEWSFWTRP